jgi:hypothetical protein
MEEPLISFLQYEGLPPSSPFTLSPARRPNLCLTSLAPGGRAGQGCERVPLPLNSLPWLTLASESFLCSLNPRALDPGYS